MSRVYEALKRAEAQRARTKQPLPTPPVDRRPAPEVAWDPDGITHIEYERIRAWVTNPTARATRLQSLMVVACHPGSGTTTTATLLAASLAKGKRSRVLLVDANFRTPCLDLLFGIGGEAGLSEGLSAERPPDGDIQPTKRENLFVLPAGRSGSFPIDIFDRGSVDEFINNLKSRFEFIVFDAAPVLNFPDACALAPHVDGALLVVEAEKTSAADARKAKRELERAGAQLFGVVLNRYREYTPRFLRGVLARAG
jgi:capsular exopolysaccharide synthesis family protein